MVLTPGPVCLLFLLDLFHRLPWEDQGISAREATGDLPSTEVPLFGERLVVVDPPPFRRGEWTHVVITHTGLGSPGGGSASLYLNGVLQGTTTSITEAFTWDLQRTQIRIGVNYVGLFDELAIFHRPLTEAEVQGLYRLEGGVAALPR